MERFLKIDLPIIGLSLLLLLPAILGPAMLRDSFQIDWVWSDQFTVELARGHLYPRWLPLSNGGAGSPTFYFYPPLAFYVSGLLGIVMPTYAAIIGCFAIALVLSGYTMLAWLHGTKRPLVGALLFMAAPYHIYDFYGRGGQAEFVAIALLPLIALGLRRAGNRRPALLAFSYAAMILAHLPLALLTSLFLIAPYCLWRRDLRSYWLPLALGVMMASIYLIPALALNPYRRSEFLWADPAYQAKNWSLIFIRSGPVPGMRTVFAAILVTSLVPTVILWFSGQRKTAVYAAACCVIAAGVIPGLWALPLLKDVQFPFRMIPLVEFAIATGVASASLSRKRLLVAASPTLILTPVFAVVHQQTHVPTMAWLQSFHPDVPENQLAIPLPWPKWPEQLGLTISLMGLAGTGALAFRQRRRRQEA